MEYKIINFEEVECFGIQINLTEDKIKKGAIFNEAWKPFITSIDYPKTRYTYGVSRNFKMNPKKYDYTACAEVGTKVLEERHFEKIVIPEGKYAKFSYKGEKTPKKVAKFFDDVFIFSAMGGTLEIDRTRGINCFELYDENYKGGRNIESVSFLLIPVI